MTADECEREPTSQDGADDGAFGDRHLRDDPEGKLRPTVESPRARVRVIVDAEFGATLVGQLGTWLCVNLLARLDGLIAEIEFLCRPVQPLALLSKLMPAISGQSTLTALLRGTCTAVSAGRICLIERASVPDASDAPVAAQIVIGQQAMPPTAATATTWCFGSAWLAYAGSRPPLPTSTPSGTDADPPARRQSLNPLGLYMAICYGVAEVFKALRGVRPGVAAEIEGVYFSLWTGEVGSSWDEIDDGPSIDSLRLPASYLIGAGAVGQAVALAVATATAGAEFVTVIDEESIDRDNRNRYVLAGVGDEGRSKSKLVAHFLRTHGTPTHSENSRWLPYATRAGSHPNLRLAALEQELRYELVLSCVDTSFARQEIQRFWPRDLIGGSTDGLRALAVYYDLRTPTACLACHNLPSDIEREADRLRGAIASQPPESQRKCLLRLGIAADVVNAVLEYLARPKCGELGEVALKKFAEKGPPAFSVGFVSVAAGLLVARDWIRYARLGPGGVCPPAKHYLALNFFNGRAVWTEQGAREDCACQSEGRYRWQKLWATEPS